MIFEDGLEKNLGLEKALTCGKFFILSLISSRLLLLSVQLTGVAVLWICGEYALFHNQQRAQFTLAKPYNRKGRIIHGWVQWQFFFLAGSLVLEFCCLVSVSTFILGNFNFSNNNSLTATKSFHIKYQNSELFFVKLIFQMRLSLKI